LSTSNSQWHNVFRCLFVAACLLMGSVGMQARGTEPTGRWKGRWVSGINGHSGPMRARISPTGSGSYKAVFAGRFALVVPFVYRAEMQPVHSWDGVNYVVEKKLGFLGTYRMQAKTDYGQMDANWSAVGDSGQIHMQRVGY
jgi:hypothetical protein